MNNAKCTNVSFPFIPLKQKREIEVAINIYIYDFMKLHFNRHNNLADMEITPYPNLLIICRLCLQENSAAIDIFKTSNLSLRIMTTVSLEVQNGDGLPHLICQNCRVQLERSYMFRKRCQLSDIKLRKHIRLINSGKKSKVFQPNEDDQEEESLEFEESLKFISNFENEEKRLCEGKRKIREMEIYETAKNEETNRLLEEFKNFIILKKQTKTTISNIEVSSPDPNFSLIANIVSSPGPSQNKNFNNCENSDIKKKNVLMFDENSEESELIFVVENHEDENNINVNEYDIQEENYESEYEDHEEECKNYSNNDADKEMNRMLQDIEGLDVSIENHQTINITSHSHEHTEINSSKEEDKMDKNNKIAKSPRKITHAKVSTKDGNIIEMEVYNTANSDDSETITRKASRLNLNIFKCSLCPQSFTRRLLLQRHTSVHLKNKQYCCVYCKKWFACKSSLDRHTRIHTGEKPFECEQCGKKFIQREILKRHMHLHTGQKPFTCTHCNQSFVQKQVLQNHINSKHTENPSLKLHECFLCPKTFMHASGLSRHLLLHTGTSYDCYDCKKKFNDKSALKRHTAAVHTSKIKSEINQ